MNNTKTTKRALLSSVIAMFLCVAMLIGTTFAWFTDSASTAVNKIQAGTLDVGLEMKDASGNWVNAEGETLGWVAADGRAQDQILWEPGCTYELPDLRLVNNGDLWLKVRVYINGIKGDAKLLEAIEFTATYETEDGASQTLTIGTDGTITEFNDQAMFPLSTTGGNYIKIKGHMKESAGNEYQGKSIDGIGITVVATQYTYENDSNNNQYDANAEYPVVVSSQTAFSDTVAASANSNIVLSAGTYTLPAAANKTVAISGTKDTVIDLTSPTGQNLSGTDLTFENVTVKGINSDYVGIQHSGDIVYNNVTFNDSTTLYGESVTFNNCTFNLSTRYIWTYGAKEVTFNNCTFNTAGKAILIYAENGVDSQTVNVNGCTFNATETGHTWNGDSCAAVEIDASLITGRYTVNFTGTNTVDSDFNGIYRIKNNSASKVTINGIN